MKVLVAGATGALGRQLVPLLVASGHEVTGMTRSPEKRELIRELGAVPVVADGLDADAVARAVGQSEPEVIVHQLTSLSGSLDMRHFDRDFELTNRLRTEGTDHLLAAGRAVGVERFVAQSFAGWPYARSGPAVKTEEDPLDPSPPDAMRRTHDAIRYLEDAVVGAETELVHDRREPLAHCGRSNNPPAIFATRSAARVSCSSVRYGAGPRRR
jgi:nucleoside-diphosphate-sugar epimerase